MNRDERIFKIIISQHISEKSSILMEHYNKITLKILKNATKKEVKDAIYNLFGTKVLKIRILITKKKSKKYRNITGYRKNFKKAYVTLKEGKALDILNNKEFKNIKT